MKNIIGFILIFKELLLKVVATQDKVVSVVYRYQYRKTISQRIVQTGTFKYWFHKNDVLSRSCVKNNSGKKAEKN